MYLFVITATNCAQVDSGTVKDVDGKEYRILKIGSKWWIEENLKTRHFHNGEAIACVADDNIDTWLTKAAYRYYNNQTSNASICGHLYNWHAVGGYADWRPKAGMYQLLRIGKY